MTEPTPRPSHPRSPAPVWLRPACVGLLGAALGVAALVAAPAQPAAANPEDAFKLAFLAPTEGPHAAAAQEHRWGVEIALGSPLATDPKLELDRGQWTTDPKKLATELKRLKKDGVAALFASVPDGFTAELEEAAVKAKLPLIVLSSEQTRPDLDRERAVFWAGGMRPVDEALAAMDFLYMPLGSRFPTILHDGSARAAEAAAKCHVLHHYSQAPKEPQAVGEMFGREQAETLGKTGTDGIVYFGGPVGAERVLRAFAAAGNKLPILLGQGNASTAVPTFFEGKVKDGWCLEPVFFEDHAGVGRDAKWALGDWEKANGRRAVPNVLRSYRSARWLMDVLSSAETDKTKVLVPALRALGRETAAGKPMYEPWGHASLVRAEFWRSTPDGEDWPACHRVRNTLLPMSGIPSVGFFSAKTFQWEPETHYVWLTWDGDKGRTIEADLKAIGLGTGGYEADLEARLLDDLIGRICSKLNQLFLRNPDGTAIPGVSYNISFTTEKPGKDVKVARRFNMLIAGDDPDAGGRASGITAWVFSTFIQRTLYVQHKLEPSLKASDRPYMVGTYKWNTSLEGNLRGDEIRALVDGFSQGMALTGAHEAGHLCGCGHDTTIPRSIMNVLEGAGLEYAWAEWAPEHIDVVEKRLGRAPVPKNR